jgi:hypothetical protein
MIRRTGDAVSLLLRAAAAIRSTMRGCHNTGAITGMRGPWSVSVGSRNPMHHPHALKALTVSRARLNALNIAALSCARSHARTRMQACQAARRSRSCRLLATAPHHTRAHTHTHTCATPAAAAPARSYSTEVEGIVVAGTVQRSRGQSDMDPGPTTPYEVRLCYGRAISRVLVQGRVFYQLKNDM